MKYYEFCVIKNGFMMGSFDNKQSAFSWSSELRSKYPDSMIEIKAHVYSKPLSAWDVGDFYLYSYIVKE